MEIREQRYGTESWGANKINHLEDKLCEKSAGTGQSQARRIT